MTKTPEHITTEIMRLASEGYGQKSIARALSMPIKTVENNMTRARRNLGAKTTAHAVALMIRGGQL